jgi:glycosyltransferase involved in cell wall biosynthesis
MAQCMKILFLTDNFPPEVNALASRTYEHCLAWVAAGAEVTVITCAPNFPQGKVYPGYRNRLCQTGMVKGIRIVRVWSYIAPNEGVARRLIDYTSFMLSAFVAGLFQKTDVIVASSPQFFPTVAAWALSVCKRRPWVFELRDLWPESVTAVGAVKPGRVIRLFEKLEIFLYRHATAIVAVSPAFRRNLVARGIDTRKIAIVTNGVDRALFPPQACDAQLAGVLGVTGKFVIGYIGTHGMAHGLDFIVRSLAKIADPRIHFLFIGDGAEKRGCVARAQELGLTNVTFLAPVPKTDVARYLSVTDVALVPLRKSDTFLSVIPSKIFESASMHKPILLGVGGQAKEIVEEYGAGICFAPEDEESFVNAVNQIAGDASLRETLIAGCDRLAAAYDRNSLALDMLRVLKDVAKQRA